MAALNARHKRIDYLIEEVAALKDKRLFLCLAGEPGPETRELERLASERLPQRSVFLTIPHQQIPELMSAADIFVLASLHEGFGLVLIEAMAAGLPVVAHDGDHFRWLLSDAALLRDLSVPGAAGEAIQHLCDDPNLGGRLRGAARALSLIHI